MRAKVASLAVKPQDTWEANDATHGLICSVRVRACCGIICGSKAPFTFTDAVGPALGIQHTFMLGDAYHSVKDV